MKEGRCGNLNVFPEISLEICPFFREMVSRNKTHSLKNYVPRASEPPRWASGWLPTESATADEAVEAVESAEVVF